MSGHSGRCFRQWRATRKRKLAQGLSWDFPVRQKVPLALRPFLTASGVNQRHAGADALALAISRYAQHNTMVGKPVRHQARGH